MRYIGLDVGTKTIGVSISDKTNTLVSPLKVIRFKTIATAIQELVNLIKEYEITTIVIGLPKNMDNTLGFAVERSIEFKEVLAKEVNIPIEFVDERLTTKEAESILIATNNKRKERKTKIDAIAAVLILETYLKRLELR